MTNQLTITEQSELNQYEGIIEHGLKTFEDVGNALLAIRDKRLYKETHKTFEDYCQERWGIARSYANRLIAASKTIKALAPIVTKIPTAETQIRPIASLAYEKQVEVWERAVESADGKIPTEKQVRAAKAEIVNFAPIEPPPLPEGKYQIIYADPPWRYDFSPTSGRKVERHYPTLDIEEIKTLPISNLAHDNCTLFLWGTSPKLPWALETMTAWGFEYKTCMVWVKDKIGMGYYARQQHELLLIGGRGQSQLPLPENRPSSIIAQPRGAHSAKPTVVYDIIESMYPDKKKIELFARNKRENWEIWGSDPRL